MMHGVPTPSSWKCPRFSFQRTAEPLGPLPHTTFPGGVFREVHLLLAILLCVGLSLVGLIPLPHEGSCWSGLLCWGRDCSLWQGDDVLCVLAPGSCVHNHDQLTPCLTFPPDALLYPYIGWAPVRWVSIHPWQGSWGLSQAVPGHCGLGMLGCVAIPVGC